MIRGRDGKRSPVFAVERRFEAWYDLKRIP
jgi:hypothetical protein